MRIFLKFIYISDLTYNTKMEIDIIKRVATKYELLTVDFSLNEILVLLKEVPLSSYGRLQVDEGSVVGYVYNYSLPISFLR